MYAALLDPSSNRQAQPGMSQEAPDFLASFNAMKIEQSKPPTDVQAMPLNVQQAVPNLDCCPQQFVKRRPSDGLLTLNNKPWFFVGTNIFPLSQRQSFDDINKIRNLMQGLKASGLNVVRIWGFLDGDGTWDENLGPGMHPFPFQVCVNGQIRQVEANVQQIDKIVRVARSLKMRLIIPLVNNWANFGGCGDGWTRNNYHIKLPRRQAILHQVRPRCQPPGGR